MARVRITGCVVGVDVDEHGFAEISDAEAERLVRLRVAEYADRVDQPADGDTQEHPTPQTDAQPDDSRSGLSGTAENPVTEQAATDEEQGREAAQEVRPVGGKPAGHAPTTAGSPKKSGRAKNIFRR